MKVEKNNSRDPIPATKHVTSLNKKMGHYSKPSPNHSTSSTHHKQALHSLQLHKEYWNKTMEC